MTNFPSAVQTSLGRTLRLGKQLGKGGEGAVFEAEGQSDVALKLYWPAKAPERRRKVAAMVSAGWHKTNSFVAFPIDVISTTNGSFLGFVMRKVGGHKPAHLLFSPASRKVEFSSVNFPFLVRAAMNVCRAVASVHATGCVIGDVNHSGFLVSEQATVTLIDSDSFQIAPTDQSFLCKVATPEYTPPEIQGQRLDHVRRTSNHDNFGLAILIFQLLFMGRHPFSGRFLGKGDMPLERAIAEYRFAYSAKKSVTNMDPPPHVPLLTDFPAYIADAFEQAFGHAAANNRPTASDWIALLGKLESELQQCSVDSAHHHVRGKSCPWCRMEKGSPGFLAFVSYRNIRFVPLNVDVGQLVAFLSGIRDPGPMPSIEAVVVSPSNRSPSATATSAISENNRRHGIGIAASIGGLLLVQTHPVGALAGIALIAGGVWAIFRAPEKLQKIIEARKQAELSWKYVQDSWSKQPKTSKYNELRSEAETTIQQLKRLPEEEKRGLLQLEQKKRERQLVQHLERFRIATHKIRKIGSGRKSVLASFGIETAADVEQHRVSAVQGFGPALISELMTWRRSMEVKFVYRANEPLNPADIAALKSNIVRKKSEYEANVRTTISNLQQAVNLATSQRKHLTASAQRAFEQLKQTEVDVKAGSGSVRTPAKYTSFACIALALVTLMQPSTSTHSAPPPVARPLPPPQLPQNREARKIEPQIPGSAGTARERAVEKQTQDIAARDKLPPMQDTVRKTDPPPVGGPYVPPQLMDGPALKPEAAPKLPDSTFVARLPEPWQPAPIGRATLDVERKEDAQRVQQRLIDLKFLEGIADGVWGPRSRGALSDFREQHGFGRGDVWDSAVENKLFSDLLSRVSARLTYLGGWTPNQGQCGGPASAPLRITSRYAEYSEGKCDFESVQPQGANRWVVRARCSVPGETFHSDVTLTRKGSQLTWDGKKGTSIYHACPE